MTLTMEQRKRIHDRLLHLIKQEVETLYMKLTEHGETALIVSIWCAVDAAQGQDTKQAAIWRDVAWDEGATDG